MLLLHDVCDLPLAEAAAATGTNANAAKATLHRARAGLARTRGRSDVDARADADVVERLARALEERSVDALALLLAEDVWGVVDGGGGVRVASRPTVGARDLLRRFVGLSKRVAAPVACRVVRLNPEPAVLVTLPAAANAVFASVHVETRNGRIAAMRVIFSWFDRLFGTYTPSWRGTTVVCGLDGFDDPSVQTTSGLLDMPFSGTDAHGQARTSTDERTEAGCSVDS